MLSSNSKFISFPKESSESPADGRMDGQKEVFLELLGHSSQKQKHTPPPHPPPQKKPAGSGWGWGVNTYMRLVDRPIFIILGKNGKFPNRTLYLQNVPTRHHSYIFAVALLYRKIHESEVWWVILFRWPIMHQYSYFCRQSHRSRNSSSPVGGMSGGNIL